MSDPVYMDAAGPRDLGALAAIEQRSFSHPWTLAQFEDLLAAGRARILVLRAPGKGSAAATSDVLAFCVCETVLDEIQIHNLAVHPDHRRRGLGGRLLRLALWLASRRGAVIAHLEVRRSNQSALDLYRSMGFEPLGVRRDYYTQPREDALWLRLLIQP